MDTYICPECRKDLILVQGKIRVHHFRHKVDDTEPCHHYTHPTESQIHKDAKMLLKTLLEKKIPISVVRSCCSCNKNDEFEIPEITESSRVLVEYRFDFNGSPKIADVAYLDNNELVCIFEIFQTHRTARENRPEPWFEINAETLIKMSNNSFASFEKLPCMRIEKCEDCSIPQITVCLTGNKQNVEEILKRKRTRIVGQVSSRTDYLILCGEKLEDGRNICEGSKYITAIQKNIKIMSAEDWL